MSDRVLITAACIPMLCGVGLLVMLSRVPARALGSATDTAVAAAVKPIASADEPSWVGVVIAESTADLAAAAPGRVDQVFVRTGDTVAAGQRLLQFDLSELNGSVQLADAQLKERASELRRFRARARAAKRRLARLKEGEAWLSKQELEGAFEEARVAEAELQAAHANMGVSRIALSQQRLRATRQTLVAPFAGTVIALGADQGDSVAEGQVVLRILGRARQVRFAVPPGGLSLRDGRRVSLQLDGHSERVPSRVDSLRPEVDPSAQLVFATASLPESFQQDGDWIPGAPVTVRPLSP